MNEYKKVVITINLKEFIPKQSIPIDFRKEICKSVNKLFPSWNSIEYDFTQEKYDGIDIKE